MIFLPFESIRFRLLLICSPNCSYRVLIHRLRKSIHLLWSFSWCLRFTMALSSCTLSSRSLSVWVWPESAFVFLPFIFYVDGIPVLVLEVNIVLIKILIDVIYLAYTRHAVADIIVLICESINLDLVIQTLYLLGPRRLSIQARSFRV